MNDPIVCITGGHLTPALAVIEEIKRRRLSWKLIFVGRRQSFESGKSPTQEERLVRALGVPFHALFTGRLQRTLSLFTFLSLLKLPIGFIQAFAFLLRKRPTAVVSFGGYIALPVVVAAWMLRIVVITHEQTEDLGLANTIIGRFAKRVIFARESGVPLRRVLFDPSASPSFSVDTKHPIIYITGGSTGAQTLNALVFPIVDTLVKTYTVIHQVGASDISKARRITESLAQDVRSQYIVAEYFDHPDLAWIYRHTSFLIGRAGANTTAEAAALGVPSLFIPLPWAAGDEQTKNAQKLVRDGMAVVLEQKNLTGETLLHRIYDMTRTIHQLKRAAEAVARKYPHDGATAVVREIERIVDTSS